MDKQLLEYLSGEIVVHEDVKRINLLFLNLDNATNVVDQAKLDHAHNPSARRGERPKKQLSQWADEAKYVVLPLCSMKKIALKQATTPLKNLKQRR